MMERDTAKYLLYHAALNAAAKSVAAATNIKRRSSDQCVSSFLSHKLSLLRFVTIITDRNTHGEMLTIP